MSFGISHFLSDGPKDNFSLVFLFRFVHGGAIATVFDEVFGVLASSAVAPSVTRYLNVTYKK